MKTLTRITTQYCVQVGPVPVIAKITSTHSHKLEEILFTAQDDHCYSLSPNVVLISTASYKRLLAVRTFSSKEEEIVLVRSRTRSNVLSPHSHDITKIILSQQFKIM